MLASTSGLAGFGQWPEHGSPVPPGSRKHPEGAATVSPLMYLLFPLLGIVAGILAGLLGVGGGLVLVAALAWLLPLFGVPPEVAMHAALASSLASIVLTAASSARAHARRGSVLWPTVAWMVPGLLLGAWLGSGVAVKLDAQTLRWIVAGYCLLAAWQTGFGRSRAPADGSGGLTASGMFIINPPHPLKAQLDATLPTVLEALSRGRGAAWSVEAGLA